MKQTVLIFYPGEVSSIGLWQPEGETSWHTHAVPRASRAVENTLFTELTTFLAAHSLDMRDITHIGVLAGPASYTELRSFIAAADSLAWAQQIPLFSFDLQATLPQDLPHLVAGAKTNVPIEPVYPRAIT